MLFQENLQFQGKRNHVDSTKQDIAIQNKKQKLDLVEYSERNNAERCSSKTDKSEALSEELANNQTPAECAGSYDKRNSGRSSRSSAHVVTEPKETHAVNKQEVLEFLRNCDVSPDLTTHSLAIESSEINGKENVDQPSLQDVKVDIVSAETSTISNRTFDKRLFLFKLELFKYYKRCLDISVEYSLFKSCIEFCEFLENYFCYRFQRE